MRAWLLWFAFLNLLWLALISALVLEETILGVVAAVIGATAGLAVARLRLIGLRVQPSWLLATARLPARTVRESGLILGALWRRIVLRQPVQGRFRTIPVSLPDDAATAETKAALLVAGESFAPNRIVVHVDLERGEMLVHDLVEERRR